ncbi:TRAP transporter substrate-binding protein [Alkalihalobacillus sp. BA299]|uniref:TRAP transporter substrate-binding protein n=1 Tax=Alkalihalobacillus sp. BA299 TaxID=2815938 RepID=UPI001ADD1DAA|nr:TRAP transporter substrate-binding protein [Alkalihalobacillus sp. BA299]
MKKASKLLSIFLITCFVLLLAACGGGNAENASNGTDTSNEGSTESEEKETYTLKFGHHLADAHSLSKQVVEFKRIVEEKTDGQVQIEIYPAGQLGQQKDLLEGLKMGTVDMTLVDTGVLANFYKPMALLDAPYLFDNLDQSVNALQGELGDKLMKGTLEEAQIRALALYPASFRSTVLTEKSVDSPDSFQLSDIAGKKIRTLDSPSVIETFKSFGAVPVSMPSGEVYSGLQTHVVEGVESNPEFLRTIKIDEVGKYIVDTKHVLVHQAIGISDKKYNELPDDLRTALDEALAESVEWYSSQAVEIDEKARQALVEAGMEIIELDLAPFKEAASPYTEKFVADNNLEELYELIKAQQ